MQLILNTKGTVLAQKARAFEIKNQDGTHKISVEKVDSIILTKGIRVTTDAMLLAIEHNIDLLLIDGQGQPQGRLWSHRFGSISTIRKKQLRFAEGERGGEWIKSMMFQRLEGMQQLLESLRRDRPAKEEVISKTIKHISGLQQKIRDLPAQSLDDAQKAQLRGWEGSASRQYFQGIAQIIPEMYRFEKRSRRPAKDMFNCALNYLYGILYGRVELALIKAGIDPFIGIFHRDEYNRPVLAYDMIELYRSWAEAVLLQLCFRKALDDTMFSTRPKGLWLETSGKKIVIGSMNDYLETVIQYKRKRRSRLVHLQEDCHELAKYILNL